ncbi:MAG TPA: acyl-CoA dehydrogenase family protein [Acidimicrobiia bacterium]
MDFSLTGHQELIRETAQRMLERECPPSLLRAHMDDRAAAAPLFTHLRDFVELGTGECTDLCLFLDEVGYVSAPGPFFATAALAVPLVVALGAAAPAGLLDRLTAGDATATVAISGRDGTWQPAPSATKWFVPDADIADVILVVEPDWRVRVLDAVDANIDVVESADSTRRLCTVEVASNSAGGTSGQLDSDAAALWLDRVYVSAAAELVGTARRLFDMALAYAKERVQFDRPIGSFQAIQHKLADMSLALERSTAAVHYGAMTVDGEVDAGSRARAAHTAKAAAGTAAQRILKDSSQIHGGIGYTWEHDLHLFLRRATVGATQFGTTTWHHDRIADLLFA